MGFYVLRVNSSFPSLFIKNKYSLHPLSPPVKKIKNPNFTILPTSEYFIIYCWTAVSYLAWKMWNRMGGIAISGEGEKQTRDTHSRGNAICRSVSLAVVANPLSWHGEPSHHGALGIAPLWCCTTQRHHSLTHFYCFGMRSTVCRRDLSKGAPCLIILVVFNWGL